MPRFTVEFQAGHFRLQPVDDWRKSAKGRRQLQRFDFLAERVSLILRRTDISETQWAVAVGEFATHTGDIANGLQGCWNPAAQLIAPEVQICQFSQRSQFRRYRAA